MWSNMDSTCLVIFFMPTVAEGIVGIVVTSGYEVFLIGFIRLRIFDECVGCVNGLC